MNRRTAIIAGASGLVATAAITSHAQAPEPANPELEKVHALLKAHDDATTNHDLDGVMKCLADKAAVMGTGPGEMWSGPEEIKGAYTHFFEGYDKGEQDFEYHFKVGNLGSEMGWLMVSGNVKGKKDGKEFTYPLNVSATVAKSGGAWKIASMHFSTLTGGPVTK
ncbi:MAG: hypothetical protein JWL90_4039 [Chthoniobacteraceae bacterium]|nr:hypothetical protein [Chthoniobacteraceae bacterium]